MIRQYLYFKLFEEKGVNDFRFSIFVDTFGHLHFEFVISAERNFLPKTFLHEIGHLVGFWFFTFKEIRKKHKSNAIRMAEEIFAWDFVMRQPSSYLNFFNLFEADRCLRIYEKYLKIRKNDPSVLSVLKSNTMYLYSVSNVRYKKLRNGKINFILKSRKKP